MKVTLIGEGSVMDIEGWRCPHCDDDLGLAAVHKHVWEAHVPPCMQCAIEAVMAQAVLQEQRSRREEGA